MINYNDFKSKLKSDISFNTNSLNTFLNPYSYLILRKNKNIFKDIDNIYIDGISFVLILKLLLFKNAKDKVLI